MRLPRTRFFTLASLLLVFTALCGPQAHAANASFGVHVRVVRHDAAAVPVDVPVPPGARKLTTSPEGDSYLFAGESRSAGQFFRQAMVERGYRLVPAGDDDALLWERDGQRIRIRMDAVLGDGDTTRIVIGNADA